MKRKLDPSIIDESDQIIDETKPSMQCDADETKPQYDADDKKVDRDERHEKGIKKE